MSEVGTGNSIARMLPAPIFCGGQPVEVVIGAPSEIASYFGAL
jgi:hypothetical protein